MLVARYKHWGQGDLKTHFSAVYTLYVITRFHILTPIYMHVSP